MTTPARIPAAAVLLHALAALEIPGFPDLDENFIVAHPPHLSQNQALDHEHVAVSTGWEFNVKNCPIDQYPGGLSATAYEGYDGSDYCDIEMVYEAPPGANLTAHASACAKAVAEWFASRQSTTAPGKRSGADDTDEVRTSTTEVC
ncbi:hypothetical protein ABZ896_51180 [Streptomyces sp. NPDC047072]|uniref:hypothetical protein n=1 Tax=Streptomyces sp. NPDC047072 TaxID=3154809 RepID=UPI0033E868A2